MLRFLGQEDIVGEAIFLDQAIGKALGEDGLSDRAEKLGEDLVRVGDCGVDGLGAVQENARLGEVVGVSGEMGDEEGFEVGEVVVFGGEVEGG